MRSFQDKQKTRKFLHSRGMLAVLFIGCILLGKSVFDMYQKSREALANKNQTISEYNELVEREDMLTDSIDSLETEEGIEKSLRENYRVAKEGEGLVVITDTDVDIETDDRITVKERFSNFFDNFFAPRE